MFDTVNNAAVNTGVHVSFWIILCLGICPRVGLQDNMALLFLVFWGISKLIKLIAWTTVLFNSMKLWGMPCRATQDGRVMVERSDKMWATGEGNGKPFQYSCLNPMNSMKWQKDRTLKDELLRSVGAQYATGEEWRNNSRKNEETESKQKQCPVEDVTGDGSKVRCLQHTIEYYCIGT